MSDIVSATIEEVRSDRDVNPARVRERLADWQNRVHELYDLIEEALGEEFTYDRSGKQRSEEEMVLRAGLQADHVPELDILRIEKPRDSLRALVVPRSLWVIGANGRLDLRVLNPKPHLYLIADRSEPLIGNADWYLISFADRLTSRALTPQLLREVISAG